MQVMNESIQNIKNQTEEFQDLLKQKTQIYDDNDMIEEEDDFNP